MKNFKIYKIKKISWLILFLALCSVLLFLAGLTNVIAVSATTDTENNESENTFECISEAKYLYNFDGAPDYVFVGLAKGGYAIFAAGSNELLEYSPYSSTIAIQADYIIYGGPATFYVPQGNVLNKIGTEDKLILNNNEKFNLSDSTRELFCIESQTENINLYNLNEIDEISLNQISLQMEPTAPAFDENNLISPTAGAKYVEHEEYFLADPTHGKNNSKSCTTVATQLMLSYNNYYNDRRLIPDEYLNGTYNENPERSPHFCSDPMYISRYTLGSNQAFHDYLYSKGVTSYLRNAKGKLDEYLMERNTDLLYKFKYTVTGEDVWPYAINSERIIAELEADRPVVLSTEKTLNGTANSPNREFNHAVLAYGYQYLAPYDDGVSYLGYIVHFGWSSNTNQIWTNSAWYNAYLSLNIEHTHNYYKRSASSGVEYSCLSCAHRTNKAPERTYINIDIFGKYGNTWRIMVRNYTETSAIIYYNEKMCFDYDAQNWTGLTDVKSIQISSGGGITIDVFENGTATSIAFCYIENGNRYISWADQLSDSQGMRVSYCQGKTYNYTQNGIGVRILGKYGGTWNLELTNRTGSERDFEYNSRMCYDADASNWSALYHVQSVHLANGASTQIQIAEYGAGTTIAISYLNDIYRYVFYANYLNPSGEMASYGNVIDTTASSCIAEGTLITLADGSQKAVEELTGDELLLVWNMETGTFDSAPILFIDSDPYRTYRVITLNFSDGTSVDVISEHGFWDFDLNRYVYLDENAAQYVGHTFNKQVVNADGTLGYAAVRLDSVEISEKETAAYSPVTYGHLCYFVNGMLSVPGGIEGFVNIFEVDGETLTVDCAAKQADLEEYGEFTYEEFCALFPIPEEIFEAFNGRYLKVAVGKGLITYEQIGELIERYSQFFG